MRSWPIGASFQRPAGIGPQPWIQGTFKSVSRSPRSARAKRGIARPSGRLAAVAWGRSGGGKDDGDQQGGGSYREHKNSAEPRSKPSVDAGSLVTAAFRAHTDQLIAHGRAIPGQVQSDCPLTCSGEAGGLGSARPWGGHDGVAQHRSG